MSLKLSHDDRAAIVKRWYDSIIDRYPAETAAFLRNQSDPFANPVGAALREELGPIVDAVCDESDPSEVASSLDRLIRVRALQDLTPAEAVGFVLTLKTVIAEVVEEDDPSVARHIDRAVDDMLLAAFDVYSRCREQVFKIRVNEIRNRSLKMMERLNSWREQRVGSVSSDA